MSADQLLREGKLDEALAELQRQIRAQPADSKLRVFLFQLLVVQGHWERALTQLSVSGEMDPATLAMVQMYREAIRCEVFREEVFAGKRSPVIFGQPEPWVALMMESLRLAADGKHSEAGRLREEALEAAPAIGGTLEREVRSGLESTTQAQPFEWLADADARLGPIVEGIVNGRYYWIPLARIRQIDIERPADLRDCVWMPVHFTWENGGDLVGLIPTRYPGSPQHADPLVRLARKTVWDEPAPNVYFGLGQRLLATDAGEYGLMDVRRITLGAGPAQESSEQHG